MNKLQLYIYKSLRGFKAVRNINPAENIQRHIHDVRRALEILDYDPAGKYLFYLVSYIDEGSLFTILRTIPDRPFDHLATTIFVPNGLRITVAEMADIVGRTTRMVSNPAVTSEEVADLHRIFAREYPVDAEAPAVVASEGRAYAWCRYGGDTGRKLEDFFGPALYQTAYLPYEGVVLVDADLGVTATADDLTDTPLAANVPLLPPETAAGGFQPHIFRKPFSKPFLVALGRSVTVTWKRPGFEDRLQDFNVERADMRVPAVATDDVRKTVTPASFYITSQSSRTQVADAVVTVNGVEIDGAHTFTQAELQDAEVVVRAPGHAVFSTRCDLAATAQALIQLPESRKIYRFELPVKTSELGAPIRFEIHTKHALTDSPIEGYELNAPMTEGNNRVNHLTFTGRAGYSRNILAAAVAVALIVGFFIGWAVPGCSSSSTGAGNAVADSIAEAIAPAQPAPAEQAPAVQAPAPAATPATAGAPAATAAPAGDAREAVAYLDANKAWNREDMERIPALRGLFDALNTYNYTALTTTWKERLSASKNFAKVVTAVEGGSRKKKFVPGAGATYCRPGDTTISYINYMYKVDP